MKKMILFLFLSFSLSTIPVFAKDPPKTYNKGYLVRNGVMSEIFLFDKNYNLLGSLGGWSPYPLKISDDTPWPIRISNCKEFFDPAHPAKCDPTGAIDTPGCYVIWYSMRDIEYYTTDWSCSVGAKNPPHTPIPANVPKKSSPPKPSKDIKHK